MSTIGGLTPEDGITSEELANFRKYGSIYGEKGVETSKEVNTSPAITQEPTRGIFSSLLGCFFKKHSSSKELKESISVGHEETAKPF